VGLWFRWGQIFAAEQDIAGVCGRGPGEEDAETRTFGVEIVNGRKSRAGCGECGGRGTGGTAGWAEELDAVSE